MVNVFLTHYVRERAPELNDITADVASELELTTQQSHRLTVLGWAETDALWVDLVQKLERIPGVRAIRNDRPGRPDTQPSQRNKVLDIARADGDEPFVLLHNDVRPALGWLERLHLDLRWSERKWGVGSSLVSPRYIPFHYSGYDLPSLVWRALNQLKATEDMVAWCAQHGFLFHEDRVDCPKWEPPTDNGHQLMMFITRPSFFDSVGGCNEAFTGSNYDDSEWGMRALMAGKRSLLSQTALVGHVSALSFGLAQALDPADNEKVFVSKWGQELFDELVTGKIWPRLHKEQESCVTSR